MEELDGALGELDFVGGREGYERGLGRLRAVTDDGDPVEVSIALLRMCELADCLSGHCVKFDKFHGTNSLVTSPLTYRELVFVPKLQEPGERETIPGFVTREDGTRAFRFPFEGVRIAVPMTSAATVTVGEETENMTVRLEAYDEENERIDEARGETSPESGLTLSVEADEDSISYLELFVEQGWAHLTRACVR